MTFAATLQGHTVTRADVTIPSAGAWWADVALDEETELSGVATLAIGDLELVGMLRAGGGSFVGRSAYHLDAGAGSWGRTIPARGYRGGPPILLSTVAHDLAAAVGETLVAGYADRRLGAWYTRPAGPAYRTLDSLVGADGWWVRPDGQTSLEARPGGAVSAAYDVIDWQPSERLVELATEAPAAFAPGSTVEVGGEVVTLGTVVLELRPGNLRLYSWCEAGDPIADGLAAAALRALERDRLLGIYEYRLVLLDGGLPSLQPTSPDIGLPVIQRALWRPGVPGVEPEPALGSKVLVAFCNGDRSRPVAIGFAGSDDEGFVPQSIAIDGDSIELGAAVLPVARYGDTVTVGAETGVLTFVPPPASSFEQSKVLA